MQGVQGLAKETRYLLLVVSLQVIDLILTWLFVHKLQIAQEVNPLLHQLPQLIIVKVLMIGLLIFYHLKDRKNCLLTYRIITTIYCIALTCAVCAVISF